MIMDGCQGKPRTPTIEDRICPNCVQWCKYAKQCVGEETYEKLMVIARRNQEKADAERRARLEAKKQQEGQI